MYNKVHTIYIYIYMCIYIYIYITMCMYMGCLQNVGSRKWSKFAFCLGPAFWRIHFSHVLFFKKKSRWLNSLSLFPKIVPSLTASAYFFEVEEDSGKGQKQVRNRSETPKRQHLPSIQPFTFVFFASILLKIRYGLDQIYNIYI